MSTKIYIELADTGTGIIVRNDHHTDESMYIEDTHIQELIELLHNYYRENVG